jgi:hypothetical protein
MSWPSPDPANPPRGAWSSDDGVEVRVAASTRSIGQAIFLFPVGLVWCAATSLFGAYAATSILQGLGLMSTAPGRAGSLGGGIFVLLWCAFFLAIGLWILWTAAMAIAGRVAVTRRGDDLDIFTGLGPIGRRRRLSAASVSGVIDHEHIIRTSRGATRRRVILLKVPGTEGVMFGAALSRRRREFMVEKLQQALGR